MLELFVVRDAKGKHLYDATIHAGDDGYVFRAGTATKVATFAQGGADARSEAVMAALEQGLADYRLGARTTDDGDRRVRPAWRIPFHLARANTRR